MQLRKEFEVHHYQSLLINENAEKYGLDINLLMDEADYLPKELCDIYVSEHGDELFVILYGDNRNIRALCEAWDRKLSIFAGFGSQDRETLRRLKYNMIQIILCEDPDIDRSEEGSLNVTRKIILPYKFSASNEPEISDEEAVELPFYMIPSHAFSLDEGKQKRLKACMPDNSLQFLYNDNKRGRGNKMTFINTDFDRIEKWLEEA